MSFRLSALPMFRSRRVSSTHAIQTTHPPTITPEKNTRYRSISFPFDRNTSPTVTHRNRPNRRSADAVLLRQPLMRPNVIAMRRDRFLDLANLLGVELSSSRFHSGCVAKDDRHCLSFLGSPFSLRQVLGAAARSRRPTRQLYVADSLPSQAFASRSSLLKTWQVESLYRPSSFPFLLGYGTSIGAPPRAAATSADPLVAWTGEPNASATVVSPSRIAV